MAMFSGMSSREERDEHGTYTSSNSGAKTVFGPSVKIEGTIETEENILIEGTVEGLIKTEGDVNVGTNAVIKADIEAANINLSGEVHGNLTINGTTTLTSTAKVFGDIQTNVLSIETGAAVKGQCTTGVGAETPETKQRVVTTETAEATS